MKQYKLLLITSALLLVSCNQASFSNQIKKKDAAHPNSGSGNPSEPACLADVNANCDANRKEVDCTAKSTEECKKLREDEKSDRSFRTVDCSAKGEDACEKSFEEEKDKNKEGSEMRVINCKPEFEAKCKKWQDDLNEKNNVPLDSSNEANKGNETGSNEDDESEEKSGDIEEGEGKVVSEFKIDASLPFDGQTKACLYFKTGKLKITFGGTRFDMSRLRFIVKRGDKEDVVDGSSPGTFPIPNWRPACSAAPTPNPAYQVANGGSRSRSNPPIIKVTKTSDTACIDIDDALDGRPGAIVLTNFDFNLKYKCK